MNEKPDPKPKPVPDPTKPLPSPHPGPTHPTDDTTEGANPKSNPADDRRDR